MSTATVITSQELRSQPVSAVRPGAKKKIWVDLDNSPHVPFFRPITEELREKGYEVLVTARDAYQVRELLQYYGVAASVVGKHYGKHKIWKALGTSGLPRLAGGSVGQAMSRDSTKQACDVSFLGTMGDQKRRPVSGRGMYC